MFEMVAFFTSLLLSALITPLVIKLYRDHQWLDDPAIHTHQKVTHHQSVPRGGGLPIFFSFLIAALLFLEIDRYLLAIILAASVLTVVGVLDDLFDLHPRVRLITGGLASLIVIGSGVGIAYVSNPFGGGVIQLDSIILPIEFLGRTRSIWLLADVFAFLFIQWNMNIVNWSKGLDGQLPAFVIVAFAFIGLVSDSFAADPTQFNNAVMSFILAGSFAGLLLFNWYPQKIMPGYGAGSLAGFFLSILAVLSGAKLATTLMVLAIPTADAIYTIIRRIASGKSPFWGDRLHLHHLLLDQLGWGRRRVAIFYAVGSLIMGLLSLHLKTTGKIVALSICFLLVFLIHGWATIKLRNKQ